MDVVGVGLNATDTLIPLPHYPVSGEKVEIQSVSVLPGGQVASTMMACQKWGLQTRYVGKVGDDSAGDLHKSAFQQAGVDARLVTAPGCASQQTVIMVDEAGERTVLWKRDEKIALRPGDLKREWITDARALHLDGLDTEAATLAATWAREAGIPVIADIDNLYDGVERLLANVDYLIVSRDIPEQLTGNSDLGQALIEVAERFGCGLTAATLGPEGVLAWNRQDFCYAPAYRVEVLDTTGAGDIFHAGFICGLLNEWPLARTLDFACAAAALNCTAFGARGGIRPMPDIEALMAGGARYSPWKGLTAATRPVSTGNSHHE